MFELEDAWINAINALARPVGRDEKLISDPEPLVRMLRSGTPMTLGARDALAELLSPGDPPIFDFVLKPERKDAKFRRQLTELDAVQSYSESIAEGKSSQVAAEEAGEDYLVDGRTIYRYRKKLKQLAERLSGMDKTTKPD